LLQKTSQQRRSRPNLLVLKEMNQIAQRTFISAIGNSLLEGWLHPTAEATAGISFQVNADQFFPAKRA
jgi:hypothetical protein